MANLEIFPLERVIFKLPFPICLLKIFLILKYILYNKRQKRQIGNFKRHERNLEI
jgi:hypothetical protein